MSAEYNSGWNAGLRAAEAIAIEWRDENRKACIKARNSISEASQMMADQLDGAAIECNAIAGEIRKLITQAPREEASPANPGPSTSIEDRL